MTYDKHKRFKAYLKFALLLCLLIGIPLFLYFKFGSEFFSAESASAMIDYLKANRNIAFLLIIIIQALQVVICILPGQPIQIASSYMFGILPGLLLSIAGAIIGVAISYTLAKYLGRDMLYLIFDKDKVDDYHSKLNSGKGLTLVMLIYLIPGVPKDLVSYVAGISEMKFRPFLIVSTIARTPAMLGSILFGHFWERDNYAAIAILCVIVAIILLAAFIKRNNIIAMMDRLEKIDNPENEKGTENKISQ